MSENRIVQELKTLHKRIWKGLTPEQRCKALDAANGHDDKKALEHAYKVARGN